VYVHRSYKKSSLTLILEVNDVLMHLNHSIILSARSVMTIEERKERPNWTGLINESVHTIDDEDIGDIMAVNRDFVVVKRGFRNVHYYYIPVDQIEGWDGHVVWLKIIEDEVKTNYERDRAPDPATYYIKDHAYGKVRPYIKAFFPQMPIIEAKGRTMPPITTREEALGAEQPRRYSCVLCDADFSTEDDLSSHVTTNH
jgi:hypothetical protein